MFLKMSRYAKRFEETKSMTFFIQAEKLLKNAIKYGKNYH